eukprot:CAMPEP_0197856286 /NCGR_PEP_ID=MMETSP1438-20131217/28292_1 /TAXON_ID=1461541 /ORGANISM="Pterosperma sp., Strain CCMP1384" /LENGTH=309 /DNA_ID=CAMNT_0043471695 /DNA_START=505 /DNA_END=1431 /DNA_ORIENTATION=-
MDQPLSSGNPQPNGLPQEKSLEDCYYFFFKTCTKGANCEFRHSDAAKERWTVCRYWVGGYCGTGNDCVYRHPSRADMSWSWTPNPAETVCTFFKRGTCTKGAACPFVHPASNESASESQQDSGSMTMMQQPQVPQFGFTPQGTSFASPVSQPSPFARVQPGGPFAGVQTGPGPFASSHSNSGPFAPDNNSAPQTAFSRLSGGGFGGPIGGPAIQWGGRPSGVGSFGGQVNGSEDAGNPGNPANPAGGHTSNHSEMSRGKGNALDDQIKQLTRRRNPIANVGAQLEATRQEGAQGKGSKGGEKQGKGGAV